MASKLEKSNLVHSLKSKWPYLYAICGEKWDQVRNAYARLIRLSWRLSRSRVSQTAQIHPSVYISPFKVRIGPGCVIGPHAVVYENSTLDDNVQLGSGCVIGSEGYVSHSLGKKIVPIIHVGGVHIHRSVQIQSLSCVNKSTNGGCTEIGEGSWIGEHVHIAHDDRLGRSCHVEPHAKLAGHVICGDNVTIGRNASIRERLVIGRCARIHSGAVVTQNVQEGRSVSGHFAIDSQKHRDQIRRLVEASD